MKNLKTLILLFILLIMAFISSPTHAFDINNPTGGGTTCSGSASSTAYCSDTSNGSNPIYGAGGAIVDAINIISFIAGVSAVIVLMIGGFRYIVSGGDSAQVNSARSMILYAIIGIIIIGLAQTIMLFVIGKL